MTPLSLEPKRDVASPLLVRESNKFLIFSFNVIRKIIPDNERASLNGIIGSIPFCAELTFPQDAFIIPDFIFSVNSIDF